MTRPKLILWLAILASVMPVGAQSPTPSPTPRTVTAPVTVVAPQSPGAEPLADQNGPIRVVQEGPVRVVQSGPVTFTLPLGIWIAWLASIATGLGAIAVILRYAKKAAKLIADAAKLIADFKTYGSVLLDIAKEFKSNSGSTLKDSIDRIEANATLAKTIADNLEKTLRDHIVATKTREEVRAEVAAENRREDLAERQQP